ncbi:SakacinP immunity protein, SpiA [Listeria floridensis FSL S10-1187]|uniref:SakacinP immunity protein, SpiA n=1 Tax=Listeria floridensis FSL S10-1187 TaxID=1265817 RepID=A0ABP3AWU0_9LIST|nr:bacteriocin immunity protein [Listeria floridensis]EUJ30550.1 SakacinP immunity protein, SpiA [Listeria floridensis FSL S10-1187]
MSKIKWFSGGNERGDQAITLINELMHDLLPVPKSESLQKTLHQYKNELERKEAAVPLILSRMNIAISNTIKKDEILLSDSQSDKIKQLASLSSIRYGY